MFKNSKFYTVFLIIFSLLFIYSVYNYYQNKVNVDKEAFALGNSKRDEIKDILNNAIDTIQIVTFDLAKKLSEKKYSKEQIEKIIKKTANENDFCLGITVAFEPKYINDTIKQLYAPYYSKKSDDIKYIENSYDYTDKSLKTSQWYTKVIDHKVIKTGQKRKGIYSREENIYTLVN